MVTLAVVSSVLYVACTRLTMHNAAVMAALFVVFGVDLIAKGLPRHCCVGGDPERARLTGCAADVPAHPSI